MYINIHNNDLWYLRLLKENYLFVCLFGFEVIVNFNWIVRATTAAAENIEKWIESYVEEEEEKAGCQLKIGSIFLKMRFFNCVIVCV